MRGVSTSRIATAIAAEPHALPWRASRARRLAKRALDLAIAIPASAVAIPVMGAVAALVRATSAGPIVLRQERVGLDGKPFQMWKFRTMRADNPDGSSRGRGEVTRDDPRLTPIGAVLRDWRFDELPQLLQVLAGTMSLVGPRPDLASNLPAYADEDLIRFAMPPGCTAWTFTRGAFANNWKARQAINAEYVRNWSIWLDLRVLIGSAGVLLAQRDTAPARAEVPGMKTAGAAR
jgi:lipopolysaccharide/colanic/teichoic acid biosynthesis glycosyltransferase